MSDPVTNVEIEDVLSSIRRLVSEDSRAAHPDHAQPLNPVSPPEALVLTQEHRVTEKADAPVVSETARDIVKSSTRLELERAIAELEAAVGLEDEAESAAGMSAPEEPSHLAAVEDVAPEDVAPSIDDLDWEAPIGRAVDGEPPLSNSQIDADVDPVAEHVEEVSSGAAQMNDPSSNDGWTATNDETIDAVEAETDLADDAHAADTAALAQDQQEDEPLTADLGVAETDATPEAENVDVSSMSTTDTVDGPDIDRAEADAATETDDAEDATADVEAAFEDASFEDVGEFEDPEGEQAPQEVISTHATVEDVHAEPADSVVDPIVTPFLRQRRAPVEADETDYVAYAAAPDDHAATMADDPFDDNDYLEDDDTDPFGDQVIDEAMLRDMVADIVRQELQGELGERITRNVRKLVRREINRALAGQDFI